MDDAGVDGLQRRRLITVHGRPTVRVATEEVDQPVVDIVWHIELGQFLQESQMPHRVKRLAEVQGNDDDVTIGEENAGHGVEWRREIIAAAGEPVGRKAN